MNKSLIKFITDFGPLLIFYTFYKKYGMEEAIIPLIIATAISVIVIYLTEKRIPAMPLIGAILVAGFGGLAIYFNVCLGLVVWAVNFKNIFIKKSFGRKFKISRRRLEHFNKPLDLFFYFFSNLK